MDRRVLREVDYLLIIIVIAIVVMGLVAVASATHAQVDAADPFAFVRRQALALAGGLLAMVIVGLVDYHNFNHWAPYLYGGSVLLLLAVLITGSDAAGAERWLQIGQIQFQPAELAKLATIIMVATVLARTPDGGWTLIGLWPVLALAGLPMFLVMLQPDLGTAMVFLAVLLAMLFVSGISWRYLLGLLGAGVAVLPLLWHYLEDYQRSRLLVFLEPGLDPTGAGYQLMQSMIAIGSGRVMGQGLFAGPQNQYNFLPEQHTDFIFSVIGEEFGFVGVTVLLGLYLVLLLRGISIVVKARDLQGALLGTGVLAMLGFQIMVNVGMTVGVMPVTGLPLPLVSYGGTSLVITMISVGLLLSIRLRHKKMYF